MAFSDESDVEMTYEKPEQAVYSHPKENEHLLTVRTLNNRLVRFISDAPTKVR